jgi:polysaccharide biosynthesis transport protein
VGEVPSGLGDDFGHYFIYEGAFESMLKINETIPSAADSRRGKPHSSSTDALEPVIGFLKRHFSLFVVFIACTTSLGLLYLFLTPPSFTATSIMVIDTRKIQVLQQQSVLGDAVVDAGIVQTEIEILKSPRISLSVINDLRLTEDPEFVSGGMLSAVPKLIFGAPKSDENLSGEQLKMRALAAFDSRRTVSRVGTTYVMEIGFRSLDPEKSAKIANAIANAYITDQLDSKYQATRRATIWLQDRIKELRTQVSAADRAVVDFKRANHIVESGNGKLMNEQQVSEINTQLITAHAETAAAKARLERTRDVTKQDITDASVADGLRSEVIIRQREQYLDYAARERIYAERYGVNHLATINLRSQMLEIRRNIDDEMKKIAESAKSDYEISATREQSLEKSLANAVSESMTTNQAQIQLHELESNSQAYRTVYDSFIQRYMESVQQQSFPITEARFIGLAIPPTGKSEPKTSLVLAMSFAFGVMLSIAAGYFREISDRVFRTASQIENVLQTDCIATLPCLKVTEAPRSEIVNRGAPMAERTITNEHSLLQYVVQSPLSVFAEELRSLKVVMDLNSIIKSNKVIGFTSTLPDEGKSTVASNFAHLLAHAGRRTILVDCDLRNPSLSRRFAPDATVGIVQVIAGKIDLAAAVWTEPSTGLIFLPTGAASKLIHTDEILGSDATKYFIDRLRELFDCVIVDFPPLAPIIDTRVTTTFIDSYVYVVEWGRTSRDIVAQWLKDATEIHDRLLGVVLNKAKMSAMTRYQGYGSRYSYSKLVARYGCVD